MLKHVFKARSGCDGYNKFLDHIAPKMIVYFLGIPILTYTAVVDLRNSRRVTKDSRIFNTIPLSWYDNRIKEM